MITERSCETCAHSMRTANEEPCRGCDGAMFWEPTAEARQKEIDKLLNDFAGRAMQAIIGSAGSMLGYEDMPKVARVSFDMAERERRRAEPKPVAIVRRGGPAA